MIELSMLELQDAELLPAREALQGAGSVNLSIVAFNTALALPEDDGNAIANAHQTIVALQSAGGDED
jgi:hypothetical protein